MILFPRAVNGYRELGSPLFAAYAALLMLLAGSIPVIAGRALILMHRNDVTSPALTRGLLYLTFAVSPLYVLTLLLAGMAGMGQYHAAVWTSVWVAAGAALHFRKKTNAPDLQGTQVSGLRIAHGVTALCLLCGFLIAHMVNHALALWSVELHGAAMEWLRLWYRSEWVEPVLLAMLLIMIATGVPMVAHHSRRSADAFRVVQMATGVYIGVFLCAHVLAVLGARVANKETDWFFAVGTQGLHNGRGMLIAYYIFAVFFLILHVGCGLRIVLTKHGVAEATANKVVYGVGGAGLILTTVIALAGFGFHAQGA